MLRDDCELLYSNCELIRSKHVIQNNITKGLSIHSGFSFNRKVDKWRDAIAFTDFTQCYLWNMAIVEFSLAAFQSVSVSLELKMTKAFCHPAEKVHIDLRFTQFQGRLVL